MGGGNVDKKGKDNERKWEKQKEEKTEMLL